MGWNLSGPPLGLLEVDDNEDTSLIQALHQIPTLKTVYLGSDSLISAHHLDQPGLACLALSIQHLTLQNLGLSTIFSVLAQCRNLESLSLISCDLCEHGANALANTFLGEQTIPKLSKLYLSKNRITDNGGAVLLQALQQNQGLMRRLKVLDLHGNCLAQASGIELKKLLENKQCGLKYLDLSSNSSLGDEVGVALAFATAKQASLEQLVLYQCGIGDETCKAFSQCLGVNKTLQRLNLYENESITISGIGCLVDCLEHKNFSLKNLEIKKPTAFSKTRSKKSHKADQVAALEFYVRLNREYHREALLLRSFSSESQYMDHGFNKAVQNGDTSAIFYLLQARPTLFLVHAPCNNKDSSPKHNGAANVATTTIRKNDDDASCVAPSLPWMTQRQTVFTPPQA